MSISLKSLLRLSFHDLAVVTIVIQGAVLSFLYPFVHFSGNGLARGLKYSLLGSIYNTKPLPDQNNS